MGLTGSSPDYTADGCLSVDNLPEWVKYCIRAEERSFDGPGCVGLAFGSDQVSALVHPFRSLLASRAAGSDPVSDCVAHPPAVPVVGRGCQRRFGTDMGRGHTAGARAGKTDRSIRTGV